MTDAQAVAELLDDRSHHIEFNGHLTNHAKHAVVALAGLGAPATTIRAYYDNYARMTPYGYALEAPRRSKHAITAANWRAFLGKRTSYSSYCAFFEREVDAFGLDETLRRYVPALLPGWAGAFTHATIHLGWALDAGSRWMAVEGLAYMAFSYVSCRPDRARAAAGPAGETPVDSLLRIAEAWERDGGALRGWVAAVLADDSDVAAGRIHPELARSGLQYRIARLLAQDHPLIDAAPSWAEGARPWEALHYAAALLYLAVPGDFVLLHLITSLHAMEKIAERLPEPSRRQAVRCFWLGLLSIVFARGEFPSRATLAALDAEYRGATDDARAATPEWERLAARAVLEEEEHNPKLVYVLRRAWERSGRRSIYRAAAAKFTTTPELPKSFEIPPSEEQ